MKTALITGGSRGIGAAAVRAMTAAGYAVAFLYRADEAAAARVAGQTGAWPIQCDICNSGAVKDAAQKVLARFHHLDALVNNAGMAQQKLLTDVTDEDWRRLLDVNLTGAFYVTRAFLPAMIAQKQGRIVNVSSIWGQVGASCEAPYSAAKAGLIGLSKALAKELAPSGITVNCLCPGVIRTDMLGDISQQTLNDLASETPLGRLGTPEDVAAAILWLCGQGAGFITGQVIGVDGGFA